MNEYIVQPSSGRPDKRSRVTHLFRHLGPGEVEYMATYASGAEATRAIGMGNAHLVGYHREEVSVLRSGGQKYHVAYGATLLEALAQAQKRALVHEVHQRMNVPALNRLPMDVLNSIYQHMNP